MSALPYSGAGGTVGAGGAATVARATAPFSAQRVVTTGLQASMVTDEGLAVGIPYPYQQTALAGSGVAGSLAAQAGPSGAVSNTAITGVVG